MKTTFIIIIIFFVLFSICFAQTQVGPTPCGADVPPVETDAFTLKESWTTGDKNFTIWEHHFNWFSSSDDYTIYDILVFADAYDSNTQLYQLWELEPVVNRTGYYRFPTWRREWGLNGGQTHYFGYITQGMPLMFTFEIFKYTCSPGYEIEF